MSVFNQLYAGQYDQLYAEKDYTNECDVIEGAIKKYGLTNSKSLLDVGCGTGGHAIELAARQYNVTGVDLSQAMLDQAEKKLQGAKQQPRPNWICADAKSFDAGRQFDAAIMMFAVVGYLTSNEDVISALRNMRRHLNVGGAFICDFWYGPSVLSVRPTDRVRVQKTKTLRVIRAASTTLDIATHTADVTFQLWTLSGNSLVSETTETHRMRYFFPQEFRLLLNLAGFELKSISAFPSLDKSIDDTTWNALTVAVAV